MEFLLSLLWRSSIEVQRIENNNISSALLLASGLLLVLASFLYNEFVLGFFDPSPPLAAETILLIRSSQLHFIAAGLVLVLVSEFVRKVPRLEALMKKKLSTNILLSSLSILLLLFVIEFSLKPFAFNNLTYKVNLFEKDQDLGWRMSSNVEEVWGGVLVKINGKGLRGPELEYEKPSGVKRLLFLGDSVTFGFTLESYEQTFPFIVESILDDRHGSEIEAINAGVGGYSPWQEYIYLADEGIKYEPDLVIISFVLNDVTEKFELRKFGGWGEGFQLSVTMTTLDNLSTKSSIFYFVKELSTHIRFGNQIQEGAKREEALQVEDLIENQDSQEVRLAWETTTENLAKIYKYTKERKIPVILVVFPYTFQFNDIVNLSGPQRLVTQHAKENNIPFVDLLPLMNIRMGERNMDPEDFFVDFNHLSPKGSEYVAEFLANYIDDYDLLNSTPFSIND